MQSSTARDSTTAARLVTYSAVFASLWVVLALLRPQTTFHLAPLIVPLVPIGAVLGDRRAVGHRSLIAATAVAGVLSLVATVVLSASGNLAGPSLLPAGGAALESVVFTVVAVLVAMGGLATRRRAHS